MKIIILCGGSGERMLQYSFPKPLNMIYGKPALHYTLSNIPEDVTDLYFIVSQHLHEYNFIQTVKNLFRNKICHFAELPYFTRGPIESALLGIKKFNFSDDENIVFLDNDVVYNFPVDFFIKHNSSHFIGYSLDSSGNESYSFVKCKNDIITQIVEKKRISDLFCCGIYGFKNITTFVDSALNFLQTHHEEEYYMSHLFHNFINNNITVYGIKFENVFHIGSLKEVTENLHKIKQPKMRICFDLDNTLVTYPDKVKDYTSVLPVYNMIELAQKLHNEGHIIIIHTARRMETHKYNIGAVIKDIAKITIDTLEKFNIPYDELIFGKPLADIYIDDRAINPFRNDFQSMGLFHCQHDLYPLNKLPNNKYNKIILNNNSIIKQGPSNILKGEIYYYQSLLTDSNITDMFPKYLGSTVNRELSTLKLEYIKGIPLYYLWLNQLLTEDIIKKLFNYLDILHNTKTTSNKPELIDVKKNYLEKLIDRFNTSDYDTLIHHKKVQSKCIENLQSYCNNEINNNIVDMIHGDFWFSNIILEFKKHIKGIDMKGSLYKDILTTGGDILYDYGKLYQSFLGFDLALYNESISKEYQTKSLHIFEQECTKRGINCITLKNITFSLVIGTIHALPNEETKQRVWIWILNTFYY